jgi:hypothetical protein
MRDANGQFVREGGSPGASGSQPAGSPGATIDGASSGPVEPEAAAAAAGTPKEPEPSKRGRKRTASGAGAAKEAQGTRLDISSAAGLLQGIHAAIAYRRGPHWLLNDGDAKAYGTALSNAMRHLPITVGQKYFDFAVLGMAVMNYEGARLAVDLQLRQRARQGASAGPGAVVYPFPQRPPSPGGEPAPASPSPNAGAPPGEPIIPDTSVDLEGA